MKPTISMVLAGLLLSGCSYTDLAKYLPATTTPVPPTATATATIYMTATKTPTITPTQPTPTFTGTPTLIYPNGTPLPTATETPAATLYVVPTRTETPIPQPLVDNGPFSSIKVSGSKLLWGSCEPSSVRATVKVGAGVPASTVLIFLRLKDTKTGDTTEWGGGAIMDKKGGGVFTYTLTAESFSHYHDYKLAWGQYQFVALDAHLKRLGASGEFLNALTVGPCP